MQVELLVATDCPNADPARTLLASCLRQVGVTAEVVERVGDYPSPTILVNGVDVMTGAVGARPGQACRLDVPTEARVTDALRSGS